ncbi:hypothetical protein CR513_57347, partial [Mucuna pruriens]
MMPLYQSRLFLFQLGQITFNKEAQLSNVARMECALRLIGRILTPPMQMQHILEELPNLTRQPPCMTFQCLPFTKMNMIQTQAR